MKTAITNRAEADKIIDQFGDNLKKIKVLQDTNKKLKAYFEDWATSNPDEAFEGDKMEGQTESFYYAMSTGTPALNVQSHLTDEDVVKRMRENDVMAEYLVETFDRDAIKANFGGSANKRKQVEDFGLYFTNPKPHLVVEAL